MKKILFATFISYFFQVYQLQGQCTVENLAIQLRSATVVNGECQVLFDFSWTQDVNNGNKFAVIHFWRTDQYPDLKAAGLAYTSSSDRPTLSDLTNALFTMIIVNNGSDNPGIGTVYYPDPLVPILSSGLTVHKETTSTPGTYQMTIKNINTTIPNCLGVGLTADVWASQSADGQNVHCLATNVSVIVGNPRVTGLLFCEIPRRYSTQVTNMGAASIDVTYNVYIDEGDAVFEPTLHDLKITATPVGPYTLTPGQVYNSGLQSYLPYSNTKPYCDRGLWIEVMTAGYPNKSLYFIENSCIPLPVSFGLFIADRNGKSVDLSWETVTESNNLGFWIQRATGGSAYEEISFIPSKAPGGNSTQTISYTFTDQNSASAVSVYRIRQVDLDGRSSYSEYRAVAGLNHEKMLYVYPNPTSNNQVYLLFADPSRKYDLALFDQQGRLTRQWKNFTGQRLNLGTVQPGIYLLKVTDPQVNAATSVKLVVMK